MSHPTKTDIPLLQRRLMEAGISEHDFCFQREDDDEKNAVPIKTLIWKVICEDRRFPIATAVNMRDKVDLKRLADCIGKTRHGHDIVLDRIILAPKDMAERMTGFPSGCMPPICHTTALPLYLDSSIIEARDALSNDDELLVGVGSGIVGCSLVLKMSKFLLVAAQTGGVRVGSIVHRPGEPKRRADANPHRPINEQERRRRLKRERVARQHQPKDRLQEYRSFFTPMERARLLKATARKKGQLAHIQALVREALSTPGEFAQLLQVRPEVEGLDKNALHIAAWRGDLETVQLLVETAGSMEPKLPVVNDISKGPGNYGKTPIFFALTQCREDVVRYLLDNGASLLLVNNKGQTPCSLAASHLREEARRELYQIEARQLRAGGRFVNYRLSHSDRDDWKDLDPRFSMDRFNYGQDLDEPLRRFQESVEKADPSTIVCGMPTMFSPRSLRPTVRWWNRDLADNNRGQCPTTSWQPTPRSIKPARIHDATIPRQDSSPMTDHVPKVPDMDSLDLLSVNDVLEGSPAEAADETVILVDCLDTICHLEQEIDATIAFSSDPVRRANLSDDVLFAKSTWGLDCEWRPVVDPDQDHPVATLQLSTRRKAFLIDVQSLCQPTHRVLELAKHVEPSHLEQKLNATLTKLFQNPCVPLLGFGILHDLGKLAASFPHLNCFSSYATVLDLQAVASVIYPKGARSLLSSLQKLVALLLEKRLDKSQQCSDWTQRPLSSAQIEYAALDASLLPLLLTTIVEKSDTVRKYSGQFFSRHFNLQFNLRYTFLNNVENDTEGRDAGEYVWSIPMGGIRRSLSGDVARQCWPSTQSAPALPKRLNPTFKGGNEDCMHQSQ